MKESTKNPDLNSSKLTISQIKDMIARGDTHWVLYEYLAFPEEYGIIDDEKK